MFFLDILEQSLLFFPLAVAVYLSYQILKIPDLTVEGSFVLGAGLFAKAIDLKFSLPVAMLGSLSSGVGIGMVVALIQRGNRVPPLITGVLMLFILMSLSLVLMGRPNISLIGKATVLTEVNRILPSALIPYSRSLILCLLGGGIVLGLGWGLNSSKGLILKAFGNNPTLLSLYGYPAERYRLLGLGLSNGLAAFAGSLTAQAYGYADLGMGAGGALIAIGTVILGAQIHHRFQRRAKPLYGLLFCGVGVLLYFSSLNIFLMMGLSPLYLKMGVGGVLLLLLMLNPQAFQERGAK